MFGEGFVLIGQNQKVTLVRLSDGEQVSLESVVEFVALENVFITLSPEHQMAARSGFYLLGPLSTAPFQSVLGPKPNSKVFLLKFIFENYSNMSK